MDLYIDVMTPDDYDKVIKFLLDNNITIKSRDKLKGQIVAEMSDDQINKLRSEASTDEDLTISKEPFLV